MLPVGYTSSEKKSISVTVVLHIFGVLLDIALLRSTEVLVQAVQYYCIELLDPERKAQRVDPTAFRYCVTVPPFCRPCPLRVFGIIVLEYIMALL